jgi:DNA-binding transcriptional LysR family regulator
VKNLTSLKGISSFVAVARNGSFTAAGKALGVSAVAVGKNVAKLEAHLAVRLFQRTTRKLALTPDGVQFYQQCSGPLRELEAAQIAVRGSAKALSGLVRMSCAAPFGAGFIVPLLPQFFAAHPKVQVELHLDDSVSDLVREGYDVGIRVGLLSESTLIARPVATLPFVAVASPTYLEQCGVPRALADLRDHNCLRLRRPGRGNAMPWFLQGITPALEAQLRSNFFANDFSALLSAAVQHQGLACVPLPLALPQFRSGVLKPVLGEFVQAKLVAYLYYPNRKNLPARTRCVVEFILAKLAQEKDLQTPHALLLAPFL